MEFVQVDLELTNHMGRQRQDQRSDVASEQAIKTTADAVVVERWQLRVGKPERLGSVPRRPFADAVKRLATEQHVLEQEDDADRGSDPAASIRTGQVGAEKLLETHPRKDSIDDGQVPIGTSSRSGPCASDLAWAWGLVGRGTWRLLGFGIGVAPEKSVTGGRIAHAVPLGKR